MCAFDKMSEDLNKLHFIKINMFHISLTHCIDIYFSIFRISAPELPTWQDCHELWSKKRKRQIREQAESMQNLPPGKPSVLPRDKSIGKPDDVLDGGG